MSGRNPCYLLKLFLYRWLTIVDIDDEQLESLRIYAHAEYNDVPRLYVEVLCRFLDPDPSFDPFQRWQEVLSLEK